jgi:hypothetical protein
MKLSAPMILMLRSIRDTGNPYDHLRTMSAHGGGSKTRDALERRGLAVMRAYGFSLTPLGKQTLHEHDTNTQ